MSSHVSALGADPQSASRYAASSGPGRGAGASAPPRRAPSCAPSIIFGSDDNFYNRIAAMTRFGPILFVPAANSEVQPVYVEDVAQLPPWLPPAGRARHL